ncbi:MAG: NAD-dependent epimerase/dehydratase family protein, partial [Planctomycetaceae bacterium]|nr:NAD-dependent epimerase/dehydratase family protein [Planctomycetaceae bacterium]
MPDLLNSYSKNHGKSCLVTGATGLVGNNVVRRFLDTGWKVKVLVRPRHSGPTVELEGLPVEKITGTLEDISSLRRAVDGIDLVIHSAAMVHCGWGYHDEMYRVNVDGTANLAEITRLAGARFIHVSSVDALGLRSDGIPTDEETSPGGIVECP